LPTTKTIRPSKEKKQKATKRQSLTETLQPFQHLLPSDLFSNSNTSRTTTMPLSSTVTSTATPTVNNLRVVRFNGNTNAYTVQEWLAFFEFAIDSISDDKDRIQELMKHLEGDAVSWFVREVAPNATRLSWAEVKSLMETRSETSLISPNIAAQNRKLKSETIKRYFDDKMSLLRCTGLSEKFMADELTSGLPFQYKTTLFAAQVKTTQQWLSVATQLLIINQIQTIINLKGIKANQSKSLPIRAKYANCRFNRTITGIASAQTDIHHNWIHIKQQVQKHHS
jgi:hypothetical protein